MQKRDDLFLKNVASFEIFLIIFAIFSFAFIIGQVSLVSAQDKKSGDPNSNYPGGESAGALNQGSGSPSAGGGRFVNSAGNTVTGSASGSGVYYDFPNGFPKGASGLEYNFGGEVGTHTFSKGFSFEKFADGTYNVKYWAFSETLNYGDR